MIIVKDFKEFSEEVTTVGINKPIPIITDDYDAVYLTGTYTGETINFAIGGTYLSCTASRRFVDYDRKVAQYKKIIESIIDIYESSTNERERDERESWL